jgi:hypothetical protein
MLVRSAFPIHPPDQSSVLDARPTSSRLAESLTNPLASPSLPLHLNMTLPPSTHSRRTSTLSSASLVPSRMISPSSCSPPWPRCALTRLMLSKSLM